MSDAFPLWLAKSNSVNGGNDPTTPMFEANAGDPVVWRVADACRRQPDLVPGLRRMSSRSITA